MKYVLFVVIAIMLSLGTFPLGGKGKILLEPLLHAQKKDILTEPVDVDLVYSDDWTFLSGVTTPLPVITEINNNYVTLPNPDNPKGFRCTVEQNKARLDMDGDGEYDNDIKKESFVVWKITYPNELQMNYKMRIFIKGKSPQGKQVWAYQRACFITAKTPLGNFTLIDDNNNGYYNDYGKDAIIVDSTKQAIPLSSIIPVKGKFYKLEVQMNPEISIADKKKPNYTGMSLRLEPYTEDTGKIDLVKNLKPPKDPAQIIVIRKGEDVFFQISGKGESIIPVGDYYLVSAIFSKRVRARSPSQSDKPLTTVEKDKTTAPVWGGPFKLRTNAYCSKGGEVIYVVPPGHLTAPQYRPKYMECPFIKMDFPTVVGSLGEEYYSPDEFKDERGYAFPDAGVGMFNVDIIPKDAPAGQKPLNKTVDSAHCQKWLPIDLSGIVEKVRPFWETYRCPIEKYRGMVVVKVWTSSSVFGELSFEQEVDVQE
ncbi:MAG: hypothetical protein QME51_07095 [Planctomycetota bacterium]|nr:hypothetical protein [Planctomycetota bacterium]MDI6788119.1 hypothetical protein [Planctomycetota bacterium]